MTARRILALLCLTCCVPGSLRATDLERINRTPFTAGGTQPGSPTAEKGAYSADGRYLLFASTSTAVIPGIVDLNGAADLFVKDAESGAIRLITAAAGAPNRTAERGSEAQQISANGNVVVFASLATDLVPLGGLEDWLLLWHDLESGTTRLINHPAGQPTIGVYGSGPLALSADGRFVLFESKESAATFVPGSTDTNGENDLFLWDAQNDTFQLVSHVAGNNLLAPAASYYGSDWQLSADGRYVAFLSFSPAFVPGDSLGFVDAFVYDRTDGSFRLASHTGAGPGAPANNFTTGICAISPDGRYLLFRSTATDLAAGIADGNGAANDTFLFDRTAAGVELISRRPAPAAATGNAGSYCGWLSSDARWVYFLSSAGDLVAGMTDASPEIDLFLRDRSSGETRLVTRRWDAANTSAGGAPGEPVSIGGRGIASADGSVFRFTTGEPGLVAAEFGGGQPWSVRYDRDQDRVELELEVIGDPGATRGSSLVAASADGSASAHSTSEAAALAGANGIPRDAPQLIDRRNAEARLVAPAAYSGTGSPSWSLDQPDAAAVSPDGRRVVFGAGSREICGSSHHAVCVHDRRAGTFTNVNHAVGSSTPLDSRMLLLDLAGESGQLLLVATEAPLLPGDGNGTWDLYRLDLASPEIVLVSSAGAGSGTAANGSSQQPSQWSSSLMSVDGARIAFETKATNLAPGIADGNGLPDVYLETLGRQARFDLVSHRAGDPFEAANGWSEAPVVAAAGSPAYFVSQATDLVAGFADGNGAGWDLYRYENTELVLVTHAAGSSTQGGDRDSRFSNLRIPSGSSSWMAYQSYAGNLIAGGADTNEDFDVFLWNGPTRTSTLVSHRLGDSLAAANGRSQLSDISADGRWVLFTSNATDLVAGLSGATTRLFLWDRNDGGVRLVSHQQGNPEVAVAGSSGQISADGRRVYFLSDSWNVIPGVEDSNSRSDLFLWERESGNLRLLTPRYGDPSRTGGGDCGLGVRDVLFENGAGVIFNCAAPDLLPNDNNGYRDLFLFQLPFFADGFESGTTGAWSLAVP